MLWFRMAFYALTHGSVFLLHVDVSTCLRKKISISYPDFCSGNYETYLMISLYSLCAHKTSRFEQDFSQTSGI
jgi:hypothetical protein